MIGREGELAHLRRLLDDKGAVVVRGEAGIGKSTLIGVLSAEAAEAGFRVLTCAGVQSETLVGMAALHQLLHACIDRADALPERQRDALRTAFGFGTGPAPDRLGLSVAVLGLLEELAQERPLLLVAEDIQWMDRLTLDIIGFVARRGADSPIVLAATCRTDGPDPLVPLDLPELTLPRLTEPVAGELLDELDPGLDREVRARLLAEAEGNPLALVELSRGRIDAGPDRLPLSARLEHAFAGRVARLPAPTQELLLLAAANTEPSLAELTLAAGRLGVSPDALAAAEEAGLVLVADGRVTFRHPLVRSAVYGTASHTRRVGAHRALAEILTGRRRPDRAAWHRASATVGRDEAVAAELEATAERATARGTLAAARESWERAAELSPDPHQQGRRLALAGEAARQAGMNPVALRLCAEAARFTADPLVLAGIAVTESILALTSGLPARDPIAMSSLAGLVGRSDPPPPEALPAALQLLGFTAIWCSAYALSTEVRGHVERELLAMPLPPASSPAGVLPTAILALLDPARHGEAAVAVLRGQVGVAWPPMGNITLGLAAEPAHDWALAAVFWRAATEGCRRSGSVSDLATAAICLGRALVVQGRLTDGLTEADEGLRLADELEQPVLGALAAAVVAHVHAWRGDAAATTAALARSRDLAPPSRTDILLWQRWSAGLAALADGQYWDAYVELVSVCAVRELGSLAIADLVEAACRGGRAEQVAPRLAEAERYTASFGSPLTRMLVHRARALLGDEPEKHFLAALDEDGYPLQTARTRLVYGEWLRRQRRISAAREQLTAAAAVFDAAGARLWAARAQAELQASGVAEPRAAVRPASPLTTQELQIARLAATGLSNKEIADQLFLSHRTVGAHLYRVYPKLGISGRGALRDAIGADAG